MIRDFDGVAGGDVTPFAADDPAAAAFTGTSALLADSGSYIAAAWKLRPLLL